MHGCLYLNNDGSKWISTHPHSMQVVLVDHTLPVEHKRHRSVRKIDYWESFGNFAAASLRVRGQRINLLPQSFPDDTTGLPVIVRPVE